MNLPSLKKPTLAKPASTPSLGPPLRKTTIPMPIWVVVGVAALLVLSTQFSPVSAARIADAERFFSTEEISAGRSYAWQRRWIFWGNFFAQAAVLLILAAAPLGKLVITEVGKRVHYQWAQHTFALYAIWWAASWTAALPFRLASFLHARWWETSSQGIVSWIGDLLGHGLLEFGLTSFAFVGLYALMRYLRGWWWGAAAATGTVLAGIYALVLPAFIDPIFNEFKPLAQTEWKFLEPKIRHMGLRPGISPTSVYVVDASRRTNTTNAYFTGVGPSERIVLYDTLLKNHTTSEVETIVAHEMGHWHQRHILQGLGFAGLGALVVFFLLDRFLTTMFVRSGRWHGPADATGVYLVLLVIWASYAISTPAQNFVSRIFERHADMHALELARNPKAFIDCEVRLAKLNKANVTPTGWNVFLFSTHPPVLDRIRRAEEWQASAPPPAPRPKAPPVP